MRKSSGVHAGLAWLGLGKFKCDDRSATQGAVCSRTIWQLNSFLKHLSRLKCKRRPTTVLSRVSI